MRLLALFALALLVAPAPASAQERPNIVVIYTDDLGYGDVSAYGATELATPNIDRLAHEGLLFTRAYATSASCTPSRYSLLTGQYAWRRENTGIARGDAALIIPTDRPTLPSILQGAGYATAVVGKWHLGLGPAGGPDWNGEIRPGPLDVGFDYSFLIPATGDRVPTVYVENRRVVGLDPADPIAVRFGEPVGDEPTGRDNPELLTMHPSHGHDNTIVDGISRIGYMRGGHAARWDDATMADEITGRAVQFLVRHQQERPGEPFFLFFSTHDIHVPRVAHPRYAGTSGLGPRGDVLLQLDGSVGDLLDALDRLGLEENTLVLFTNDNGPVLDDGYQDQAVELLGDHDPFGPMRGGKYSAFEAGTRTPFIVRWPARIPPGGVTDALFSQVDLLASFAALADAPVPPDAGPDSFDFSDVLIGTSGDGRPHVVQQSASSTLSVIQWPWKYIAPSEGRAYIPQKDVETGNAPEPQLYHLGDDPQEQRNVAAEHPQVLAELEALLERVRAGAVAGLGEGTR